MTKTITIISALALAGGLAACAQVPGGSVPAAPGRAPDSIRAIPIHTPVPTPTPEPASKPSHDD